MINNRNLEIRYIFLKERNKTSRSNSPETLVDFKSLELIAMIRLSAPEIKPNRITFRQCYEG